jgi:hypothetical protein
MAVPFVAYENVVMLLAPQDIASTATTCPYMSLKYAHKAAFLVVYGAVTSTTVTNTSVITIEAATAEGGTEAAIAFRYRRAGALGENTWGAVTSVGATGVEVASASDDNTMWYIEIDPDELAANDYAVARVVLTDNDDLEACLVTVLGLTEPRYHQTTHTSVTASASA